MQFFVEFSRICAGSAAALSFAFLTTRCVPFALRHHADFDSSVSTKTRCEMNFSRSARCECESQINIKWVAHVCVLCWPIFAIDAKSYTCRHIHYLRIDFYRNAIFRFSDTYHTHTPHFRAKTQGKKLKLRKTICGPYRTLLFFCPPFARSGRWNSREWQREVTREYGKQWSGIYVVPPHTPPVRNRIFVFASVTSAWEESHVWRHCRRGMCNGNVKRIDQFDLISAMRWSVSPSLSSLFFFSCARSLFAKPVFLSFPFYGWIRGKWERQLKLCHRITVRVQA